jgi:hypothetical protein
MAMCLMAVALPVSVAMAQSVKMPSGPVGPPGGLPGVSMPGGSMPGGSMPMPSMPSAPAPSLSLPTPAPMQPPPVVVVPPPPPAPERARDAGGPSECDCYRTVDGRRVFTGRNVACCPK